MIAQSILQLFPVSRSPPDTFQDYTVVERITASTVGVATAFFDQALPLPGYTAQLFFLFTGHTHDTDNAL